MTYKPEPYWDRVARDIRERDGSRFIAGDDTPYYRYKRSRFLSMLSAVDFRDRIVMELGPGPGGNLAVVAGSGIKALYACDVSKEMIELARHNLKHQNGSIHYVHIDGRRIPLDDRSVDVSFASTVLQHNTDDAMMRDILGELCRVTKSELHLFEETNRQRKGTDLCVARPVDDYREICRMHGLEMYGREYININVSYLVCGGVTRLFNKAGRMEGQPVSDTAVLLQRLALPVTHVLDKLFTSRKNLTRMSFRRKS